MSEPTTERTASGPWHPDGELPDMPDRLAHDEEDNPVEATEPEPEPAGE